LWRQSAPNRDSGFALSRIPEPREWLNPESPSPRTSDTAILDSTPMPAHQFVCFFLVRLGVVAGGLVGATAVDVPLVADRLSCNRLS
jgi:hypothetical protein